MTCTFIPARQVFLRFVISLFLVVIIFALAEGIYFFWVLSKGGSPEKADLIVVFCGDEARVKEGFKLAKSGYTSHLVISPASDKAVKDFEKRSAPINPAISLIIEPRARTTFENAFYAKKIILEHGFKSMILVTSFYHIPRAYFLIRAMLAGSKTKVLLWPVNHKRLNQSNWFESYDGIKLILNEMLKFWLSIIETGMYAVSGEIPERHPKQWTVIRFMSSFYE